ncbi:roadblock/LC7 domain-containing protein [Aquifex pyrophilus]
MELDLVGYELDERDKEKLEGIVNRFCEKASPHAVFLFDKGGRVILFKGEGIKDLEAEFFSSIMSALFFASEELTKMIEEKETLNDIFYETKTRIFTIAKLEKDFLVGVVCNKDMSIGSVRLFFREFVKGLNEVLKNVKKVEKKLYKISPQELEKKLSEVLD